MSCKSELCRFEEAECEMHSDPLEWPGWAPSLTFPLGWPLGCHEAPSPGGSLGLMLHYSWSGQNLSLPPPLDLLVQTQTQTHSTCSGEISAHVGMLCVYRYKGWAWRSQGF